MVEPVTRVEIENIKDDIVKIEVVVRQQEMDTKAQFKEQATAISAIRDSGFKMEFLVNHIIESQNSMIEQNKETARENKETNKTILDGLSSLENAPFLAWKNMNILVKSTVVVTIVTFLVTYFYGTFTSFLGGN